MTFWRLYYHLTWSTKDRAPLIIPDIEPRLFAYLVRKAAEMEVYVYAVNGWNDHIHLLIAVPPKLALAEVVKELKGSSSHDINHELKLGYPFAWQRGYGALSLGEKQRPVAEAYIRDQKVHHQQQSTHAWLERCSELDEGPTDTGVKIPSVPAAVHEPDADYDIPGESFF
jgi:putative transposase